MFVGHYGVSFAIKRWEPKIPLWLLFVAAQFLDILWAPFVLLGIEKVRVVPGFMPASPLDLYYIPYSHGLLTALFWSVLFYAVVRYITCREWPVRAPILLGVAVFSHWVLDFITHGHDLPLWGDQDKVGLGLWNHPTASALAEAGVLLGGIWLSGMAKGGRWRWWVFAAVLLAVQFGGDLGPPPSSPVVIGISGLLIYVVLATAAWWLERWRKQGTTP
ncbi:MAG: hypothetical protein ACREL2_10085 [Gemmatimonadales bacterium]